MFKMDKFVIEGGRPLNGEVSISGAKNAVLPMMACTLLADGEYHLQNVPRLRDVRTMEKLLKSIGAESVYTDDGIQIKSLKCDNQEAPYELVKTMRASIYVLGPLLGRYGYARVSLPGGCAWGPRPVNLHIEGLKKMGASIQLENGYIIAKAKKLHGAHITFDIPSVGATGNLLMAATMAKGVTVLENAAREPEIMAVIQFLRKMGASIQGEGTSELVIEGGRPLQAVSERVIPDRIELGTFMVAAHITGGSLKFSNVQPGHVGAIIDKLQESGADVESGEDFINIRSNNKVKPVDVTTSVYPGFPTDMQAQWMALMSIAKGTSIITDTIFHDRFTHVAELRRLGALIRLDNNVAAIQGTASLNGAPVMSTDLRASASLILAGLAARGRTDISRVYHIDRGYDHIEKKLSALGANIYRDQEELIT